MQRHRSLIALDQRHRLGHHTPQRIEKLTLDCGTNGTERLFDKVTNHETHVNANIEVGSERTRTVTPYFILV